MSNAYYSGLQRNLQPARVCPTLMWKVRSFVSISGMNSDSFIFWSKYILEDLQSVNDTLALAGIYLISKTCISGIFAISDLVKTYIISRAGSRDVIKLYGGEWAGMLQRKTS